MLDGDSIFTSGGFRTRSFSPTSTNSWYYYSRGLCTASSQVYNGSTKEQTHLEKTTEYDGDSKNELDCFNDSHTGSEDEDDCDFSDSNDIEDNETDSLRTKENFWTTEYNDVVDPERIVSKPLKTPDIKRLVKSFSQSHITQAVARENRLSGIIKLMLLHFSLEPGSPMCAWGVFGSRLINVVAIQKSMCIFAICN